MTAPAIAHTLMCGSDGERDDQEEAARLEAHPSFAAVLGRRCLVPSGDCYLCILRRSLLAARRPMIGYAGALRSVMPLRSNLSCPGASRASDQHPPSTAGWSANTRRAVARRRDRDGGFLCCKPGQADPWESVYCGSDASHACHPLEEMTRNLTPNKTLGPIERMLVGVSTSERYPALRGWQQ